METKNLKYFHTCSFLTNLDAGSSKVMEAAARKAVKERQIDGQRERQTARTRETAAAGTSVKLP